MKRIFRIIRTIIIIGILIFAFLFIRGQMSGAVDVSEEDYDSEYIYVINREDKEGLFKKNYKTKAYPASLTKIMTTIVAIENLGDLSTTAPIDRDTYLNMVENNASMAGFYSNEPTTYRDLLYATILNSAGEAANSLAVNISGDVETFVDLMNSKAKEIGLKDTNFTNPEGLHDDNQYTTAYDMALLLDYALENEHFRTIFTQETFQSISTLNHPGGILLRSTVLSRLHGLSQEGFEIIGGKSGTTYESGQCWATLAVKDGVEYITIVMGSELKDIHNAKNLHIDDSIRLYEQIK